MFELGIALTIFSPYLTILPVVFSIIKIVKRELIIEINPLNSGIFLLFVIGLISGVINKSVNSIVASFVLLLLLFICIYLQNKLTDRDKINNFIEKVWGISCISGILGIFEKVASLFVDMTWTSQLYFNGPYTPSVAHYRIYSTFGNPNVAGSWFAVMILVGIYLFDKEQGRKKFLYFTSIGIFICGLIFSGSKGATMGLEAGVLIYLLLNKNYKSKIVLSVIFLMVLSLALLSPEITHPLNGRDEIWHDAFNLFLKNPILGSGIFGIYESVNEVHAHNIWLSFLSMFGIVGILIYMWIKAYLFKGLYYVYKEQPALISLLTAIQISIIVHGIVDFIIMSPQGGIMFLTCSSLIVSLSKSFFKYPAIDPDKLSFSGVNMVTKDK